jgi:hypothetical protein
MDTLSSFCSPIQKRTLRACHCSVPDLTVAVAAAQRVAHGGSARLRAGRGVLAVSLGEDVLRCVARVVAHGRAHARVVEQDLDHLRGATTHRG